jgi:transposase-like protein
MLALASVLEGSSREAAARAAGMDRQTLRDWVHRYNAVGLPGLHDRPRSGRKPDPGRGASRASPRSKGPSWRRSWSGGRTRTATAWCVGAGST